MKYQCYRCNHEGLISKMILKLGGLLCNNCNVIVYKPYMDFEYFDEVKRRDGAAPVDDDDGNGNDADQKPDLVMTTCDEVVSRRNDKPTDYNLYTQVPP